MNRRQLKRHHDQRDRQQKIKKLVKKSASIKDAKAFIKSVKAGETNLTAGLTVYEALHHEVNAIEKFGKAAEVEAKVLLGELLLALKVACFRSGFKWEQWATTNIPDYNPRKRQYRMQLAKIPHVGDYAFIGASNLISLDCRLFRNLYPRDFHKNPIKDFFSESRFPYYENMTVEDFKDEVVARLFWVMAKREGLKLEFSKVIALVRLKAEMGSKLINALHQTVSVGGSINLHLKNLISTKGTKPKLSQKDQEVSTMNLSFDRASAMVIDVAPKYIKNEELLAKVPLQMLAKLESQVKALSDAHIMADLMNHTA